MPVYSFKCSCRHKQTVVRPMSESNLPVLCEIDGFVMRRDFQADFGKQRIADTWPLISTAAGVSPDEVPEMMEFDKAHGVPTQYTPDGDPIFTSKGHRKKYCSAHGLYDRSAGYGDPAPKNR